MGKSTVKFAVLDGVVRAFALYLALDFTTSVYADGAVILCVAIAAIAGLVLPFLFGALSFRKAQGRLPIGKYALLSSGVFVLSALVFELVIDLTAHIRLLPGRELANVDGLLMLAVLGAFLLLNLIGRAAVLAAIWSKQKGAADAAPQAHN